MNELPYFVSWQNQSKRKTFDLEKYDGIYFHLSNGSKLLDLSSTSYHTSFGGNPKSIVNHVIERLKIEATACPKAETQYKNDISARLLRFMEKAEGKIYYTLSGSESVENALKIARQITKKTAIVARRRSYHGATLGALSATGDWRNQGSQTPKEWVLRIPEPYEDPDFVKAKKTIEDYGIDKIAAIIIEPISAANGVIIPPEEWIENLHLFCRENSIFIIYDEVCTGFYRTGKKFAYQLSEHASPDMVCLGKNISGGVFPFGAVWTNEKISKYFENETLLCGSTNYAHPGGLAALDSVLNILEDQVFVDSLAPLIRTFHNALDQLNGHPQVKEIRKIGLLAAVELNREIEWKEVIQNGIYCRVHGDYLTLAPPYVFSSKELIEGIQKIHDLL